MTWQGFHRDTMVDRQDKPLLVVYHTTGLRFRVRRCVRPEVTTDRLWVTDQGEPITYWGLFPTFRRLEARSGVPQLRAHLFRHGFARTALQNHAERAAVMDMLGHTTDKMARRYAGSVRQETAAKMMPQYAPEV